MKTAFDKFISRLDTTKETISELEDISLEISKTKKQIEQIVKGKKK